MTVYVGTAILILRTEAVAGKSYEYFRSVCLCALPPCSLPLKDSHRFFDAVIIQLEFTEGSASESSSHPLLPKCGKSCTGITICKVLGMPELKMTMPGRPHPKPPKPSQSFPKHADRVRLLGAGEPC